MFKRFFKKCLICCLRTVCTTFTYFVFRFVTISRCRRRMIFSFHMVKQYFNFFDSFDFFLYAATNWCLRRIAVVCPNQVVIFFNVDHARIKRSRRFHLNSSKIVRRFRMSLETKSFQARISFRSFFFFN